MTKEIWINLPVKDLNKSKEFFTKLGFSLNSQHSSAESVSFFIGDKKVVLMLFTESSFKYFTGSNIADTKQGAEVLFSIDAESKEEVNEMAKKAREAGGTVYEEPSGEGWMYGCGFADLDGHRWNVLFMDFSQMPKA